MNPTNIIAKITSISLRKGPKKVSNVIRNNPRVQKATKDYLDALAKFYEQLEQSSYKGDQDAFVKDISGK